MTVIAFTQPAPIEDVDWDKQSIRGIDGEWRFVRSRPWAAFCVLHKRMGVPVSGDSLAAAVWPAREPAAEGNRGTLIWNLRKALAGTRYSVRTWHLLGGVSYELVVSQD